MPDQVLLVPTPVPGPRGPRGVQGQVGAKGDTGATGPSGSGSIAHTTELLVGDGAGAADASGIDAADVAALVANNSGTNTGDQVNITGNAATVTTNANSTGDVISVGNATTLANVPKTATYEADPTGVPKNTGGWLEYEVTANDAYTGQTFQDIVDLVSGELSPGARYEIEAKLMFSMSADATGMRVGVHGAGSGSAATCLVTVTGTSTNAGNAATYVQATIDASGNSLMTFASVVGIIRISGFVTTRSGGTPTISLQHLKITSGTSTCLPGSKMRLRKCAY